MRAAWMLGLLACGASAARAQPAPFRWALRADTVLAWTPATAWTADSLGPAARSALGWLRRAGHPDARLDSAVVDGAAGWLYATPGPRRTVAAVRFEGTNVIPNDRHRAGFRTRAGAALADTTLDADLRALVRAYADAGLPLAEAEADVTPTDSGLVVTVAVDEGRDLVVGRVEVPERARTNAAFAARLAGVETGRPVRGIRPDDVADRLRTSGLFRRVGAPTLERQADGTALVRLVFEDEPPGAFDLVFGILPPATRGAKAQVIGSGSLVLRNLFGRGQGAAVRFDRLPGRTATATARLTSLYPFGVPLRFEGRFDGVQQDSTLGTQRYRAEAAYRFDRLDVAALATLDRARPGPAGARVVGDRQRVATSDALFSGVGLRAARLDRLANPRRGATLDLVAEAGLRRRALTERDPTGTLLRVRVRERQARLDAHGRLYVPLTRRAVGAVGVDVWALRAVAPDEADLFRLGGATTLRGYDEERFRPRAAARGLAELRFLIDETSYAFAFFDGGVIDQPEVPGVARLAGFYPGYGVGVQLSTPAGLVVATYAASPEVGLAAGRIHVGLSLGL